MVTGVAWAAGVTPRHVVGIRGEAGAAGVSVARLRPLLYMGVLFLNCAGRAWLGVLGSSEWWASREVGAGAVGRGQDQAGCGRQVACGGQQRLAVQNPKFLCRHQVSCVTRGGVLDDRLLLDQLFHHFHVQCSFFSLLLSRHQSYPAQKYKAASRPSHFPEVSSRMEWGSDSPQS